MATTSAVASGARSMLRAASSRSRFASQAKSVPPMFRATSRSSSLLSPLRNRVEMSFCVESMLPYHTATASALMTSMLSTSAHTYAWLSHGIFPQSTHILCLTNPLFLYWVSRYFFFLFFV
ncbi:unnamed protein product [Brassica rapa subsp. trilocularis]